MSSIDLSAVPIYHITHIDNLEHILKSGGLWCDSERINQQFHSINIAHQELKERRMRTQVKTAINGMLGEYVPFYFCNRSPMLYSIHKGYVEGYSEGQASVIYLVSSVGNIINANCSYCFTDGHAAEKISEFYESPDHLHKVDWPVIDSWRWNNNRDGDTDRKRRKQAEFLVKGRFPWQLVERIGVFDDLHKQKVSAFLSSQSHRPPVNIEKDWYYT